MSESIDKKAQQPESFFTYAFNPAHVKNVLIKIATAYDTPKIISINSYPIALICRFIQLLILSYALGYVLWYKRGYQDRDPSLISSVTLEVKGFGSARENPTMILDNADYIIPPQENNAIFIMTNFINTDQQRTFCGEGIDVKDAICRNHSQCVSKHKTSPKTHGHWTGKCRMSEGRCEMEGWCPVENDLNLPQPIMDSLNYTIFLKNFVEFTRFRVSRTNILNQSKYFRNCLYHPKKDKLCPIFRIGDILNIVEHDDDERLKMLISGAVVRIKIDWMCNLDLGDDQCKPRYSFGRLDSRSRNEQFSFGFNFRYASHWKIENESHRTLTKAFGLRFIVSVNGNAGRFDFLILTLNIGSMIGVLGVATFICDIVALHFSKQSYFYRKQKFQTVDLEHTSSKESITVKLPSNKERMARKTVRTKEIYTEQTKGTAC